MHYPVSKFFVVILFISACISTSLLQGAGCFVAWAAGVSPWDYAMQGLQQLCHAQKFSRPTSVPSIASGPSHGAPAVLQHAAAPVRRVPLGRSRQRAPTYTTAEPSTKEDHKKVLPAVPSATTATVGAPPLAQPVQPIAKSVPVRPGVPRQATLRKSQQSFSDLFAELNSEEQVRLGALASIVEGSEDERTPAASVPACNILPGAASSASSGTALHRFAAHQSSDLKALRKCSKGLVIGGCSVDRADADGDTALHKAAREGNPHTLRVLLERGAKANVKNQKGQTPLDCAHEGAPGSRRDEAIMLLTQHDAAMRVLDRVAREIKQRNYAITGL